MGGGGGKKKTWRRKKSLSRIFAFIDIFKKDEAMEAQLI